MEVVQRSRGIAPAGLPPGVRVRDLNEWRDVTVIWGEDAVGVVDYEFAGLERSRSWVGRAER
jgi:hypothetical protein